VVSVNTRCAQLFPGWQAPGTRLRDVLPGDARQQLEHQLARRAAGHRDRYQLRVRDAAGEVVWLQVAGNPLLLPDGTACGSVAVLTDITATKLEELRQQTAARTDPLTGAATRLTLDDRLGHALSRRDAGLVAVLFCDVDRLKAVNDRSGHAAGDELLREVSRRITGALRPSDTLARYGGDEFVVVCEELPSAHEARQLAERVRTAVSAGPGGEDRTISVGVATSPPCTGAQELLAAADSAAYVAKRAGGDAVHVSG
jgi:diguanylate cyclase (GGDEF)-like protein/PAS domain S-box-containing protein